MPVASTKITDFTAVAAAAAVTVVAALVVSFWPLPVSKRDGKAVGVLAN